MKKIYLFAVIFALLTGFATFFFVNGLKNNSAITGVEEANVVVALQDIEPDTVVNPSMFTTVKMPVSAISYGTLVSPADIDGYVVTTKILKGEQVLAAKLTLIDKDKDGLEYNGEYRLSYHLENGHYAFTLYAAAVEDTVARFIRQGDYVNIYFIDSPAKPLLKNVKVLQIGKYNDYKTSLQGTEIVEYDHLTLSLTEQEIEKILPYGNDADSHNLIVTLVPYTEGAGITLPAESTTVNEQGETETVTRVREPVTNRGMGEVQTTTTTTAKS